MASRHSANVRRRRVATYGSGYQTVFRYGADCWYCGEPAETEDHVPPLAAIEKLKTPDRHRWLIPSCRECNGLLSSRPHRNPVERREALRNLLARRYARLIASPGWTSAELEEIGSVKLRRVVENHVEDKAIIKRRLESVVLEVAMVANGLSVNDSDYMTDGE